jgi:hypothetical protein
MISIICYIPFYHENIINSIQSVLCQSYKNWELLIGYNKIDKKLMELFTELSVINNIYITYLEDKERPLVLNILTNKSNYEWIALLDSHTIWTHDKLEQQMFIAENQYSVIGTNIHLSTSSIPTRDLQNINFFEKNPISLSTILIKKYLCNWSDTWINSEDYDLILKLWIKRIQFYNLSHKYVKVININSFLDYSAYNKNMIDHYTKKFSKNRNSHPFNRK